MNFAYSDDQKALAELARKILTDKATHERIGVIEKSDDGFDRETNHGVRRESRL